MEDYTCDEILRELASRFVNTNGIEFCDLQLLKDVSNKIWEHLLYSQPDLWSD